MNYCNICEQESEFAPFGGDDPRYFALCRNCGSLERDRFTWLYLQTLDMRSDTRLLHIAPDECYGSRKLRPLLSNNYQTLSIDGKADIKADLCDLPIVDESYDIVLCSHVLEHIIDDKKAIKEIGRILKKSGIAVVIVPFGAKNTDECFDDMPIEERYQRFGHPGHWRAYGTDDFEVMLLSCGLKSSKITLDDFPLTEEQFNRLGITRKTGYLFSCTRDD